MRIQGCVLEREPRSLSHFRKGRLVPHHVGGGGLFGVGVEVGVLSDGGASLVGGLAFLLLLVGWALAVLVRALALGAAAGTVAPVAGEALDEHGALFATLRAHTGGGAPATQGVGSAAVALAVCGAWLA